MRIVIPLTQQNICLAAKTMQWALDLGGLKNLPLIVAHRHDVNISEIFDLAGYLCEDFQDLIVLGLTEASIWHEIAAEAYNHFYDDAWYFWPPSATPLRPGWLEDIAASWESRPAKKTIVGHVSDSILDPAAVYSGSIHVTGKKPDAVDRRNDVFQWYGVGKGSKHFDSWQDVVDTVDFTCAVYHGCEDGSLIDRLEERQNSTDVNVPVHGAMEYYEPPLEVPPGRVSILIVTYAKDYPWLDYCLKALRKFASGFHEIVVAVPDVDVFALPDMTGVRVYPYRDVKDKGFLMHAYQIGLADEICPEADFIMHLDADCIAKEPVDAGNFFECGKPVLVWRPYKSLVDQQTKVISDCAKWGPIAENSIGMPITAYVMCRHPNIYSRKLYPAFRARVGAVHSSVLQHILAQKNSFPQTFAEHPAMGGFAFERMHEDYHWVNCDERAPRDLFRVFWSHGGIDQPTGDGFHDGRPITPGTPVRHTARDEIEHLLR